MGKVRYVCAECGSSDIQVKTWVDPNTGEIVDIDYDNECWCDNCFKHTQLKEIIE